ncbi:hypothetical protein ACM26V_11455 [Salipaludibacillus sp. HK11]|uniref:hypothetical protein n=1 Tax=Salipaludibacillus sp. HK11 TaxID=3394320 RepID=UPI0039FDC491
MKQHDRRDCFLSYNKIYVRSSYDWKGSQGVELSLNDSGIMIFADTYKKAMKDLRIWMLRDLDDERIRDFQSDDYLIMIQSSMSAFEKKELDTSLQKWAEDIS